MKLWHRLLLSVVSFTLIFLGVRMAMITLFSESAKTKSFESATKNPTASQKELQLPQGQSGPHRDARVQQMRAEHEAAVRERTADWENERAARKQAREEKVRALMEGDAAGRELTTGTRDLPQKQLTSTNRAELQPYDERVKAQRAAYEARVKEQRAAYEARVKEAKARHENQLREKRH